MHKMWCLGNAGGADMTPVEARARVYNAVADTLEGMGLSEMIAPRELESLAATVGHNALHAVFGELVRELRSRAATRGTGLL